MADSSNVSKRTRPGTRLRRRCARKRLREALEHSDISEEMEVNTPNAPLGSDLGSSSWPSSSGSQSSSSQSSGGIPLVHRIIAEEAWSQWGSKISSPKITDCEFVASYNWLQEDKPSIIVPGGPRCLKKPQLADWETQRCGFFCDEDENVRRWPKHPMEPAVRAMLEMNGKFETRSVDIVTCATTLGNLHKLASGTPASFLFNLELVGNTAFLVRKLKSPKELIRDDPPFASLLHEGSTYWDKRVKGSASHHRVIRYSFGGLNLMVRCEPSGYVRRLGAEKTVTSTAARAWTEDSRFTATGHVPAEESCTLKVDRRGFKVFQSALVDIKMRDTESDLTLTKQIPHLWTSQITNSVTAYHENGDLSDTRKNVGVKKWETENESLLLRLAAILFQIVDLAKTTSPVKLEANRNDDGPLEIRYKTDETGVQGCVLPDDLKVMWEHGNSKLAEGTHIDL